jgi:trans-2,3-dihydro-3-hydroxyanthranilate isomerase
MFSPLGGTVEDPATGSANAALVALRANLAPAADATVAFTVLHGVEIGRPSVVEVSAEKRDGTVGRVPVGGRCAPVMEGTLAIGRIAPLVHPAR